MAIDFGKAVQGSDRGHNESSGSYAFLYSGGPYTTLNDPLGVDGTLAESVNDSGQIVGSCSDVGNAERGFSAIPPRQPCFLPLALRNWWQ